MRIGRFEVGRARHEAPAPQVGEIGLASSNLYSRGISSYNPDALIGRKGAQIYRDMSKDDALKGPLLFFKYATVARKIDFKLDGEHPEASAQKDFADLFWAMVDNQLAGTWIDKLVGIQTAHEFGFSMTEKVVEPFEWRGRTYWGLKDLKLRPFETFEMTADQHGNLTSLRQSAGGTSVALDPQRFIHFINRPDIDPHFGRSDLFDCYREWWSKDIIIRFWNIHLERHGSAIPLAKVTGQLSAEEKAQLQTLLKYGFSSRAGAYYGSNIDLQVIWPQNARTHNEAIEYYNRAMSRSMLMPSLMGLSEQGSTGSYSQAAIQQDTLEMYLEARALRLADVLNEQLIAPLAAWNTTLQDVPRLVPGPLSEANKRSIVDTWTKAVSGGSVTHDLASENKVRALLDFPEREEMEPLPPALPAETLPGEDADDAPIGQGDDERELAEPAGRVNFARIERWSEQEVGRGVVKVGAVMNAIWKNLRRQIERELAVVDIPQGLRAGLRRELFDGMRRAWQRSTQEAATELPSARRLSEFAARAPGSGFDQVAAEKFLKQFSMTASRKLTEDLLATVQQQLLLGLKNGLSTQQVISNLLPLIEDYIPAVNASGATVSKAARVETIVRTNWWTAIDEARWSYFRDPALEGFVEAFEYSAIMDDRTTEICAHLDGRIYPADSQEWQSIRPPNHFNCRSLLIPVTAIDEWKASAPPTVQPQEGFR